MQVTHTINRSLNRSTRIHTPRIIRSIILDHIPEHRVLVLILSLQKRRLAVMINLLVPVFTRPAALARRALSVTAPDYQGHMHSGRVGVGLCFPGAFGVVLHGVGDSAGIVSLLVSEAREEEGVHRMRDIIQRRKELDTRLAITSMRIVWVLYFRVIPVIWTMPGRPRCEDMVAT